MSTRMSTSTIETPFTILIDNREKAPYSFTGLVADAAQKRKPVVVPTRYATLDSGDYSIDGLEDLVAIERKSLADLYSTMGSHRERFEREHERLATKRFAAVVIESDWETIIRCPPRDSRLNPKTIIRTSQAWSIRYGVHWIPAVDRRFAEIWTYQALSKFWDWHQHQPPQERHNEKEEKELTHAT